METIPCGVEGCTAPVRWVLKDHQADGDLHSGLCQDHWTELHRHAWVIAMTGYDLVASGPPAVEKPAEAIDVNP
jgi:hypothetical protein